MVVSVHGIGILVFIQEGFQERGSIAEVLELGQVWGEGAGIAEVSIHTQRPQPDSSLDWVCPSIGDALGRVGIDQRPRQLMVGDHPLTGCASIVP